LKKVIKKAGKLFGKEENNLKSGQPFWPSLEKSHVFCLHSIFFPFFLSQDSADPSYFIFKDFKDFRFAGHPARPLTKRSVFALKGR